MEIELIDEILEALLFVSGNGLSVKDIIEILGMQKSEINNAVNRLKSKYCGKSGIHLISYNGKIQLCTNPSYADVVAQVLSPIKERELSNSALETVAIIAYKQPVTKLDIEEIRGVNCDYAVQVLLKHGLIEAVGRRDAVGKPLLFGTTDSFLKRFRIESLADLPDYEMLLETMKVVSNVAPQPSEKSLYNEFEIPEDSNSENLTDGEKAEENAKDAAGESDTDFPEEEMPDFLKGEELQKIE